MGKINLYDKIVI